MCRRCVGCLRWRPPMSSHAGRPWRGRCGCSRSSASSSPTRPGSTARWRRTPRRWSPICGGPPSTADLAGRTLLDVGGGPGYFADAFAARGAALHRRRARSRARCTRRPAPAQRAPAAFVRASGMALPFADASVDICLSSNVAEHVPRPWQLGARDAARHPAGRAGDPVVHGVAGPVRRPRDGADALPRRRPRGRAATPANTAIRRKTTTDRRCSRYRPPTGWTGRTAPGRWSPHFPATTRDGRGW